VQRSVKTIAVVDDSPELLELFQLVLELEGYHVVLIWDGPRAYQLIKAIRPDLVILDLLLPELPGWDVLESLRADPETAGVPVIVCSAAVVRQATKLLLEQRGCPFLAKPFDLKQLLDLVRRLLDDRSASRPSSGLPGQESASSLPSLAPAPATNVPPQNSCSPQGTSSS
jgi:DNA-binding response OmpR family regulator